MGLRDEPGARMPEKRLERAYSVGGVPLAWLAFWSSPSMSSKGLSAVEVEANVSKQESHAK